MEEKKSLELGIDMNPSYNELEQKKIHLSGGENFQFESSIILKMEKERGIIIVNVEREQEIEKIAWQVFQNTLKLKFRNELTLEQKKKITDTPEYEYYREKAIEIYEKKQRALLNKKYPVIDIPASGKSGMCGGAFTLCFVYSKYKGNFVLRGYMREVEEYLEKNYTHYFCNFSLWHNGQNRDIWKFWKESIGIFDPTPRERKKGKKIMVRPYGGSWLRNAPNKDEIKEKTFNFKRLPKRWIPEFDKL